MHKIPEEPTSSNAVESCEWQICYSINNEAKERKVCRVSLFFAQDGYIRI